MRRRLTGGNKLDLSLSLGSSGFVAFQGVDFTKGTYADWVTSLAATGCTVDDLGVSSDGANNLYGLSYGTTGKPVILIIGTQHGSEWWSTYSIRQWMSNLVTPTQGSGLAVADLLSKFKYYAIPCANPYGFINNVRNNATEVGGKYVDLNRNYNWNWATYDDSGDAYSKGAAAESEAETQIIVNKISELAPIAVIDMHSGYATYDLALYYTKNSNEQIWTNVIDAIEFIMPNERIIIENDMPMLYLYTRTVLSYQNRFPLTCIFEVGHEEVSLTQSRNAMNFLLFASQQIGEWQDNNYPIYLASDSVNDTQIYKTVPTYNYGINTSIGAGTTNANEPRRGLIKFPFDYLIRNYEGIKTAILELYLDSEAASDDENVAIHKALTEWFEGAKNNGEPGAGEDGSTWNLRNANGAVAWGAAGGQSAVDYTAIATDTTAITGPTGQYYEWDVAADVEDFSFGDTNYGWWLLNGDEVNANTRKTFQSGANTNQPRLTLTFNNRVTWDHEWQFNGTLNDNPATGKTAVNLTHADAAVYTPDGYGRKSNALVLDGSTDNAKNTSPGLDITTLGATFSIIIEATPDNVAVGNPAYWVSLTSIANIGWAIYTNPVTQYITLHNGTTTLAAGVPLTDEVFYKVVWVQDAGNAKVYINGSEAASGAFAAPAAQTAYKLVIGDRDDGLRKMTGNISRIAIIKGTALTPAQIKAE